MGRRFLHRRVLRSGAAAGAGAHQAQPRARGGARHQVQYSAVQYTVQYSTVQYSTVQLDTRALALLADSCTNLTTLGFYNCGFREPGAGAELLAADVAARRREQEEEAALALSCSWLDVERLTITSEVGVAADIFCFDQCNVLSDRSQAADCHHVHVS